MKSSWNEQKLSEFVEIIMGQSPKSEYYNFDKDGMPFLQGNRTFGNLYPTYDTWCSNPTKIAKKNSVLMSVRAPVGDINIAPSDLCIGRGLSSLSMKNSNNRFLYYLLKANHKKILSNESGTVFGSVNKNTIENISVLVTSNEKEQEAITNILSSLDDKIELNNKINKNLEELAQTLYKRWFVDYEFPNEDGEPYKSSGGEMVESELGLIPKGWEFLELNKVIRNQRDKARNSIFPVLSAVKEGKLVLSSEFFTKDVPSKDLSKYLIVGKGMFSYNPARINIGSIGLNEFNFAGCVSPVYVVLKVETSYVGFFSEYFKTQEFRDQVVLRASGSVRQTLSYEDFGRIKIVYPPVKVIKHFNNFFVNIDQNIKLYEKQNKKLSDIRDELLPKLMSGEIEVLIEE